MLLGEAGIGTADSIVDVGGGDGAFAQTLLGRGHRDLTVVDLAESALNAGRTRLGQAQEQVAWIKADARTWSPTPTWRVWHDRAAFHFLTTDDDRSRYRQTLAAATSVGSLVCVGTFAADGPTHCSGLPVARYDKDALVQALRGDHLALDLLGATREDHETPGGSVQHFTWVLLRRAS